MERKLLYEGDKYSVGEDGILINPNNIPLTNIIYELSLIIRKLEADNKILRLQATSISYAHEIASLETENKHLSNEIKDLQNKYDIKCNEYTELENRMRSLVYTATGGRLSYANYTLDAIHQAYQDQLNFEVERKTNELEEDVSMIKKERDNWEQLVKHADNQIEELEQCLRKIRHESRCGCDMFMERDKHENYEVMVEWMKKFSIIISLVNDVIGEQK